MRTRVRKSKQASKNEEPGEAIITFFFSVLYTQLFNLNVNKVENTGGLKVIIIRIIRKGSKFDSLLTTRKYNLINLQSSLFFFVNYLLFFWFIKYFCYLREKNCIYAYFIYARTLKLINETYSFLNVRE